MRLEEGGCCSSDSLFKMESKYFSENGLAAVKRLLRRSETFSVCMHDAVSGKMSQPCVICPLSENNLGKGRFSTHAAPLGKPKCALACDRASS